MDQPWKVWLHRYTRALCDGNFHYKYTPRTRRENSCEKHTLGAWKMGFLQTGCVKSYQGNAPKKTWEFAQGVGRKSTVNLFYLLSETWWKEKKILQRIQSGLFSQAPYRFFGKHFQLPPFLGKLWICIFTTCRHIFPSVYNCAAR